MRRWRRRAQRTIRLWNRRRTHLGCTERGGQVGEAARGAALAAVVMAGELRVAMVAMVAEGVLRVA